MSLHYSQIKRNLSFRTCFKNDIPAVNIYNNDNYFAIGSKILSDLKKKDICSLRIVNEYTVEKINFIVENIIDGIVKLRYINKITTHNFEKEYKQSMKVTDYPKRRIVAPTINTSGEQYQYQQPKQRLCSIHPQLPNEKLCAPKIDTCSIIDQTRKRSYEQSKEPIIYESYERRQYNPPKKQNVNEKIDFNFMKELDHVYHSLGINDEELEILSNFDDLKV
jgi:hypothetical protein